MEKQLQYLKDVRSDAQKIAKETGQKVNSIIHIRFKNDGQFPPACPYCGQCKPMSDILYSDKCIDCEQDEILEKMRLFFTNANEIMEKAKMASIKINVTRVKDAHHEMQHIKRHAENLVYRAKRQRTPHDNFLDTIEHQYNVVCQCAVNVDVLVSETKETRRLKHEATVRRHVNVCRICHSITPYHIMIKHDGECRQCIYKRLHPRKQKYG